PPPATTMGRRNVSNVPAQALTLLNDPFVVEQSRRWAERVLAGAGEAGAGGVGGVDRTAVGGAPAGAGGGGGGEFLGDRRDDAAAWAELCHAMFNAKEFLFVP